MTAQTYGEALYEAIQGGAKVTDALSGLSLVLGRHGRLSLYREALRDAQIRFEKDDARQTAHITLARTTDQKKFAKEIKTFIEENGATHTAVAVDERIIGGFVASSAEVQLDASYKKSLLSMYQSLIA